MDELFPVMYYKTDIKTRGVAMSKFVDRLKKSQDAKLVYLVRGIDQGKPAWYYVRVNSKMVLPLFLRDLDSGRPDLTKFSIILECGWGEDPPEEARKRYENMT